MLVTCLSAVKGSGSISEQLRVALNGDIIPQSDLRTNSSKEKSHSITRDVLVRIWEGSVCIEKF